MNLPIIIQGGMGVGMSGWPLARKCSLHRDVLGTVSGVGAENLLARILQSGDIGRQVRRALRNFPFPEVAEKIIRRYFAEGGIPAGRKFKSVPAFSLEPNRDLIELAVAGSFALVWLAKEGHSSPVSVNYLEKIQIPHVFHLFGAMLAGADFVTMGAGITLQIPAVLDAFSRGEQASYRVFVEGSERTETICFDPQSFFGRKLPDLKRPGFLPIVSSNLLASLMARRLPGGIQGFVVELPTAGGHNAPPRDKTAFSETGEPVYGPKDEVSFGKLQQLGIPFWIGGSFASPEGLAKALSLGASGIQAGSIFALSDDSGLDPLFLKEMRRRGYLGELSIRTDPNASPTGFPLKVVQLAGTLSDFEVYESRKRICDLCALRTPYLRSDGAIGAIGYRCPAEPVESYLLKGGELKDTAEARCICNGLFSAVGLGNPSEAPIITLGDDLSFLRHLMRDESGSYTAYDAIAYLLS